MDGAGASWTEREHHGWSGSIMDGAGAPWTEQEHHATTVLSLQVLPPPTPASAVMSYAMSSGTTHGTLRGVLMACLFWMKGEGLMLAD